MKKYSLFIPIIAFILFIGAKQKQEQKDEGFKNLQVLPKDISGEKLDSIMDNFKFSLGVKCSFCHARFADTTIQHLDLVSDAKEEKKTARKMLLMVNDINAKNFSASKDTLQSVICFTCHRGATKPDSKLFLSQIDSMNREEHKKWKK